MSLERDPQLAMWRRRRARDTFVSRNSETITTSDVGDLARALQGVHLIAEELQQAVRAIDQRVALLEQFVIEAGQLKRA
jgi:hypothetical protein